MAIGNWELMQECFPNSRAWEQQEWNKIQKQTKTVRSEASVWKEVKLARNKKVPNQYIIIINKICYYFIRYGESSMTFNLQKIKWPWAIKKWKIIHPPPYSYIIWFKKTITIGQKNLFQPSTNSPCIEMFIKFGGKYNSIKLLHHISKKILIPIRM